MHPIESTLSLLPKVVIVCLVATGIFLTLPDSSWAQGGPSQASNSEQLPLKAKALEAMKRATKTFRAKVASHGGYVYYYDNLLDRRWGEGEATKDQIWVQPPGTPTVGMAYLHAYAASQDPVFLDAARDTAKALIYGQLASGGWTNCIDFDPNGDRVALYRNGRGRGKNNSSLDDGQTQSAIKFLVLADQAIHLQDAEIHESATLALESFLAAQFPCGGFPQVWTEPSADLPVLKANYPTYDWRTENKIKEYWTLYTLNDNTAGYISDTLITAYEVYKDEQYLESLRQLGDFLILAQMPEPQPAWAQQYHFDMQPAWARRFEPPAISGESQGVIQTLMQIYQVTGDTKYLEPIPRALDYLDRSLLPDGRLARYYELESNRPLYMNRTGNEYYLTYDDRDLPDHYAWKVSSQSALLRRSYDRLIDEQSKGLRAGSQNKISKPVDSETARQLIDQLDDRGLWVSVADNTRSVGQLKLPIGTEYISSQVFVDNLTTLADFLQSSDP